MGIYIPNRSDSDGLPTDEEEDDDDDEPEPCDECFYVHGHAPWCSENQFPENEDE